MAIDLGKDGAKRKLDGRMISATLDGGGGIETVSFSIDVVLEHHMPNSAHGWEDLSELDKRHFAEDYAHFVYHRKHGQYPQWVDIKIPDDGATPALRYEQPIGTAIGGFVVGRYAKMNGNPNTGTIVGVKDENGRVKVTVQFPEPQPLDGPEGARSTRFELDWRNISSTWAPMLTPEQIAGALAAQGETFDKSRVGHYLSTAELAEKVRSQKNWAMGEVFSCAVDPKRFLILKQVAPSSCEMLTISQDGFQDVLTAYRYSQDELVAQLSAYVGLEKPVFDKRVIIADVIDSVPIDTVDPEGFGIERANPGQQDVTLRMSGVYTHQEVEACLRDMKAVQRAVDAETERRSRLLAQRAEYARSSAALRAEQLKIIYEGTDPDYRGIAGDRWPVEHQGKPTIVIGENGASVLVLLENLTDDQIRERLPNALKQQAARAASTPSVADAIPARYRPENLEADSFYVAEATTGRVVSGPFERVGEIPLALMGYDGAHKVKTGQDIRDEATPPASKDSPELKYLQTDRDNCRVYYKIGRELFAYQRETHSDFALYCCTRSGEPLSKVRNRTVDSIPDDYELFSRWARETGICVKGRELPAIDDIGDSVDDITESVEKTLRAHGIEPDHCWREMSVEISEKQPALSAWLREAGERWDEATERADRCRP